MRAFLSKVWSGDRGSDREDFSEEEKSLGITGDVVSFVEELSKLPMTWVEFPVEVVLEQNHISVDPAIIKSMDGEDGRRRSPVPIVLSSRQARHAQLILLRCPSLGELRLRLCPRFLDDDLFWGIYFVLTAQHLHALRLHVPLDQDDGPTLPPSPSPSSPQHASSFSWEEASKQGVGALSRAVRRRGLALPNDIRSQAYARLACGSDPTNGMTLSPPDVNVPYHEAFGQVIPDGVLQMPRFGCNMEWSNLCALLSLPPEQRASCRRVLASCALLCGHLRCPLLPVCVALLSSSLPESSLLECSLRLLRSSSAVPRSSPLAVRCEQPLPCRPFLRSSHATVFWRLLVRRHPQVATAMRRCGVSSGALCRRWHERLMIHACADEEGRKHMGDRWLMCGWRAVHEAALGLVFAGQQMMERADGEKQMWAAVEACEKRWGQMLGRLAAAARIGKREWLEVLQEGEVDEDEGLTQGSSSSSGAKSPRPSPGPSRAANQSDAAVVEWEDDPPAYWRPRVDEHSEALRGCDEGLVWEALYQWMPARMRGGGGPKMLYGSGRDGTSLRTMHRLCSGDDEGNAMVGLVGVDGGNNDLKAIGWFGWGLEGKESGEGFVFCIRQRGKVKKWGWAGGHQRPQTRMEAGVLVVGDNAIVVDEDMRGTARPSQAFGLKHALTRSETDSQADQQDDSFKVRDLEIWTISL